MQCVKKTELHNAPFVSDVCRKKERLIELVKCANEEELALIADVLDRYVPKEAGDAR